MQRFLIRLIVLSCLFTAPSLYAHEDGVFQVYLAEEGAFLWLPPASERIEGILVAGTTSIEKDVVRDPRVREVCRRRNLAIVFGTSGLNGFFGQELLDKLAEASGYEELSTAPLFFVGHSAGGPQAKQQAAAFGGRTFGLMLSRGGIPDAGSRFPTLVLTGQFDEFGGLMRDENGREPAWENPRDALAQVLEADRELFVSFAVEAGAGHFGWSERNAELFALFLDKAAAGVRESYPSPLPLRGNQIPVPGDPRWTRQMDREFAEALSRYNAPLQDSRRDQFLRWENRHWVDAGVRNFFHALDFEGDGQTFRVRPVFAERVPGQHNGNGPRWLEAGQDVGNAGGEIKIRVVSGPAVVVEGHRLRLQHDALNPAQGPWGRLTFLAYSEGNGEFRHTELPGMAPRGYRGPQGQTQTITFDEIHEIHGGENPIPLVASASSGLPVSFYVLRGPAVVKDGQLHITQVPARPKYPIEIEVVAYQAGSGVEPRFSPAPGISQVTRLHPLPRRRGE